MTETLGNLVSPIADVGMDDERVHEGEEEDDEEFGQDVSGERWTEMRSEEKKERGQDIEGGIIRGA